MVEGKVKFFNTNKGFGFIEIEGQDDIFLHISEVQNNEELTEGDEVRFEIGEGDKGKKAIKVNKL